MAILDDLLNEDGVFAAGEFDDDGKLVGFAAKEGMELPPEVAELVAQYCTQTDRHFDDLAEKFTAQSNMKWTPRIGWVYAGGDYTIAVSNNLGVFAKTFDVDFNDLFNALVGAR